MYLPLSTEKAHVIYDCKNSKYFEPDRNIDWGDNLEIKETEYEEMLSIEKGNGKIVFRVGLQMTDLAIYLYWKKIVIIVIIVTYMLQCFVFPV